MSTFTHRSYRHDISVTDTDLTISVEGRPELAGSFGVPDVHLNVEGKDRYGDDLYTHLSFAGDRGREDLVELIKTLQLAHDATFGADSDPAKDGVIQLSLNGTRIMEQADYARLAAYVEVYPRMEAAMAEHRRTLEAVKAGARRIADLATVIAAKSSEPWVAETLAPAICVTEYELRDADLEPVYAAALMEESA